MKVRHGREGEKKERIACLSAAHAVLSVSFNFPSSALAWPRGTAARSKLAQPSRPKRRRRRGSATRHLSLCITCLCTSTGMHDIPLLSSPAASSHHDILDVLDITLQTSPQQVSSYRTSHLTRNKLPRKQHGCMALARWERRLR